MNSGPFGGAVGLYDGFYGGFGGGHGHGHGHGHEHGFGQQLGAPVSSSVLLEGGTGEPGAAADVPKRKGGGREEKEATALRSHSEAERRRRERINAHLATLRSMVPCTDKKYFEYKRSDDIWAGTAKRPPADVCYTSTTSMVVGSTCGQPSDRSPATSRLSSSPLINSRNNDFVQKQLLCPGLDRSAPSKDL